MPAPAPPRSPDLLPRTEEEARRSLLMGRLAGALEDMRTRGLTVEQLGEDPLTWKDRPDLERLLETWEEGEHPAQHPRA